MFSDNNFRTRFYAVAACASVLVPWSAPITAQERSESSEMRPLETVVVTARRRDETLLEVPVSVTALSAEDLRSANAFGLEDLAQLTPGLNFSALPGGFAEPTIRGLTQTDQLGLIGNVGVFVDGIFLNNRASIEFGNMDLAQIEVLKGPQAALFGRDTFAGAINYRTRAPVLGEFDGMVEAQVGSDELYGLRGSFNLPMGDNFAVRLFGGTSSFDGTITNEREGASDNLGGWEERSTYGLQALYDNGPFRVKLMHLKNRQEEDNPGTRALRFTENTGGTVYVIPDGQGGTFTNGSLPKGDLPNIDRVDIDPRGRGLKGDIELSYAVVEYDFDFATLSATVSTSESNYSSLFDNFGDPANYTRPFFPLTPDLSNYFFTDQTGDAAEQDSYEIRLASNNDGGLDWQVGIVRFDASTGGVLSTTTPLISDRNTLETITRVEERIVQEIDAVFGAVSVPVTPRLNIGAELRYTWEDQALTDKADIFFFPVVSRPFSSIDAEFNYWGGRLSVDYLYDDNTMFYGSVSRGVKTGGINAAQQGTEFATYDEETNLSYELGVKTQMLDGRLTLVGALFYIDWEDLQSTAPGDIGIGPVVLNGLGSPSSQGIELDATFAVTDQFRVRVATTWLDPTYGDDFTDQAIEGFCPQTTAVPTVQRCSATVSGTQLARTPDFQFFASGTYTWPDALWGMDAYARADYSYEGEKFSTSQNSAAITAIELVNLRAGLRSEMLEFAFWMDNAFDEALLLRGTVFTDPSDGLVCSACGALASTRLTAGNGRTFGATVTKRF